MILFREGLFLGAGPEGRGDRGSGPPLKNHKNKEVQSNTGSDPLKNLKAIKPVFNVVSTSPRQQSAIYMGSKQYWSGFHERSQSYQASIQCWANIGTHLYGVLLTMARLWWYLDSSSLKASSQVLKTVLKYLM